MFGRILGALVLGVAVSSVASAQVVTYYQPAAAPVVVPQATYYAPSISVPATTYYAPAAPAPAPTVTTYYAPAVTYYAPPPATPRRVSVYHSSVSSMPVGSVSAAAPVVEVPVGAPAVATLAPPVITYRPVVAVPQSYVVTRGLFGRPHYYPVTPAPVATVIVP